MEDSEKQTYRFENIEVDVLGNCLKRDNRETHLRRKSFQVLVYLLEHHERVVTKDELMKTVWPDVAVTDDVLVQCIKEIRRTLVDDPHDPRCIKTVPKIGYRFICPIEESLNGSYSEEVTFMEIEIEEEFKKNLTDFSFNFNFISESMLNRFKSSPRLLLTFLFVFISAVAGSLYLAQNFSMSGSSEIRLTPVPGKKSIAVMYFENLSDDKEFEWLREGLTDMLITNLSRSGKLNILSRAKLHTLSDRVETGVIEKNGLEKALKIARLAQAESFITGGYSRIENKIRVDAHLHDVQTGNLLATETLYVENPEQILTGIDILSLKIVKHFTSGEKETPTNFAHLMTDNLEAFRDYSLAVEKAQALQNKEAIELLEKAVALDPQFAMAHARIGYAFAVTWGQTEKGKPHLEKAFKLSERLNEKDRLHILAWYAIANNDYQSAIHTYREIIAKYPLETESYWSLSRLLTGEEQMEKAVEVLKQGLAVDPHDKDIYNRLGGIYSELGRHAEAIAAHRHYVSLAPSEANAYDSLGLSYQWAGDYEAAMTNYNLALGLNPDFEIALVHLANSRFQIGQYNEAINLFRRYIEIAPSDDERARGWDSIAQVYLKKRDIAAAEKAANEVLKFRRNMVWSAFAAASEKNDSGRAAKFEKAVFLKSTTNDRGARIKQRFEFYYRGYIALKKRQIEKALTNFREAVNRKPPIWNIEAFEDCLANAFLQIGRYDDAIAEYQRILQLNPNYPLARFHLAQAYEKKGLKEEARKSYQLFLQSWQKADDDIPEIMAAQKYISQS